MTNYNINKDGCFLKWFGINEFSEKGQKPLYLSFIDNYYFQISAKDLPKIFEDTFVGSPLSPAQKIALYNSFQNNPSYIEMRNVENNNLVLRTNSIFHQNNNLPNIENNTFIFDFDCNNTFIYNPTNKQNTCVYLALYFYLDPSAVAFVGGVPRYERLLVSDIFNWVEFPAGIDTRDYFKNQKHLSVLEYKTTNNSFGLVYEKLGFGNLNNTNKIRIPIYLDFPQFKNKEENYRNSEGFYTKINSISEKEYTLFTDYLDNEAHQTLSIAFLHPFVTINGELFFQNTGYEIEYTQEANHTKLAKAKTKLISSPYNTQNPNFKF